MNREEIDCRESKVKDLKKNYKLKNQLYHYTSFDTLFGILGKQELWMGSTLNMKDELEGKYLNTKIREELIKEMPNKKDLCQKIFEEIDNKERYVFAFCLSKREDDAAQWDRYANHGNGVCIVFNTVNLMRLFYYTNAKTVIFPVYYKKLVKQHYLYKKARELLLSNSISNADMKELVGMLKANGFAYKHPSFFGEDEVRLMTIGTEEFQNANKEFVLIGDQIREILKVDLKGMCKDACILFEDVIEKIVIGPTSNQNQVELENFLLSLGYNRLAKKIESPNCPLR